jgi:glucose/arabinose dehydrogenase
LIGIVVALTSTKVFQQKQLSHIPSQYVQDSFNQSKGPIPSIPFTLHNSFTIHIFAEHLGNPRDMMLTANGTLLVSNPKENTVIALPDKNRDGFADRQKVIINEGNHIHGLAMYKNMIYVAEVDNVVRYTWDENNLIATKDRVLFNLPQNSDHNNRTLIFDSLGNMYISIGSTCNVCNETPEIGGSLWISNSEGIKPQIFATGLRNAPFLAINPVTKELWATEMGRDFLGDNLPPDEINIIKKDKNYGWPLCYGNKIHDTNFDKKASNPCINTESPLFEIPAHSAPLGIVFVDSSQFPSDWQGDLLIAYHGSWNRSTASGYKVVHMKVRGNSIVSAEDFLTGFLEGTDKDLSKARPVDLLFDKQGNLYISDDKGGNIFIIQKN